MEIRRFLILIMSGLIVGGCTVPEPPSPQESLTEVLPESTVVPDAFVEELEAFVLPANWIEAFVDPMLMMNMVGNPVLEPIALEAKVRLQRVAAALEE